MRKQYDTTRFAATTALAALFAGSVAAQTSEGGNTASANDIFPPQL